MSSIWTRLWSRFLSKRVSLSIMIIGLDNSGKTSILNSLSSIDNTTTRTVGYNYERIQYKNLSLVILDFSGQNKYRGLWQEFYNCVDGIVFVIDSSDLIRLVVVRDELENMLSHPFFGTLENNSNHRNTNVKMASSSTTTSDPLLTQKQISVSQGKLIQSPLERGSQQHHQHQQEQQSVRCKVPILFLANKTDLANSVDTEVIIKALNLQQLPSDRHPWSIQATSVKLNQGISEAFDWLIGQFSM